MMTNDKLHFSPSILNNKIFLFHRLILVNISFRKSIENRHSYYKFQNFEITFLSLSLNERNK